MLVTNRGSKTSNKLITIDFRNAFYKLIFSNQLLKVTENTSHITRQKNQLNTEHIDILNTRIRDYSYFFKQNGGNSSVVDQNAFKQLPFSFSAMEREKD